MPVATQPSRIYQLTEQDLEQAVEQLHGFVQEHGPLFVITGAGISHASGIPTYRDDSGNWKSRNPIKHQDFMANPAVRQRYWARSMHGWQAVSSAEPNAAHRALARLEELGLVSLLLTQNVDRLHHKAGQKRVVELHGRLDQVICMHCRTPTPRIQIQHWLLQHNSHIVDRQAELAPDGDADVRDDLVSSMRVPECEYCGGILKPDVVFFGDSVNKDLVAELMQQLEAAGALLVVGSSLMVFSSFRFCRHAAERQIPMACINQGVTRADHLFALKLEQDCGALLTRLLECLD